jgi:hypothetical protein
MRNAQYLRAQAEFCLEVARQMSDDTIVENLQVEAARYQEPRPLKQSTIAIRQPLILKRPARTYSRKSEIVTRKMALNHRRKSEPTSGCCGTSSVKSFRLLSKKTRRDLYHLEWRIS